MRKISLMLTALFALSGCDTEFYQARHVIKKGAIYSEICVDGVVYLRSGSQFLTPKINKDAMPHTCMMSHGDKRATYQ